MTNSMTLCRAAMAGVALSIAAAGAAAQFAGGVGASPGSSFSSGGAFRSGFGTPGFNSSGWNGSSGFSNTPGLSVSGSFRDGRWSGELHLNSGFRDWYRPGPYGPWGSGGYGSGITIWRDGNPYFYDGYTYYYRPALPINGMVAGVDPTLIPGIRMQMEAMKPPPPPPPPPTDIEQARLDYAAGLLDSARTRLDAHLTATPGDADAMRLLSLVLLEGRHDEDAAAIMRGAYRKEPSLASSPLSVESLGLDGTRTHDMLGRAVSRAHKNKSASAWLLVAVIMQGEGRNQDAAAMLKRATDAGLEKELADRFKVALDPKAAKPEEPKQPAASTVPATQPAPNAVPATVPEK
jgi:hypothetical protein